MDPSSPSTLGPPRRRQSLSRSLLQIFSHSFGPNLFDSHVCDFAPGSIFLSVINFFPFQLLLGVSRDTDPKDCVSLLEGQRVHKTLQTINSFVNDEPENEVATQVWAFTGKDTQLSADFVQGTQDVSDQSFIRGVDFSNPEEAEQLVNSYMAKTSDGKVESVFTDLNSSSNLLFLNSFNFQGWSLPV